MDAIPFLTASWRKLIMVNYEVPRELLLPHLPHGTELDLHNGRCYVSLIGFLFADVRLKGWRIPFHVKFEEINLRFYVRHVDEAGVSRQGRGVPPGAGAAGGSQFDCEYVLRRDLPDAVDAAHLEALRGGPYRLL